MPKKELSFEGAMERLEEIVDSLESGSCPLEESLSLFEEGVKLVKLCNKKLEGVEGAVFVVIHELGQAGNIAATENTDLLVQLVGFAVVEDFQCFSSISGRNHTFAEGGHDLFRSFFIDFHVECDHAAECRTRISIAGFFVNIQQRFAGAAHRGTGGHPSDSGADRAADSLCGEIL